MLTSRGYESAHDLRQMPDLLLAARAATDDAPCMARYPHIGVATFRFESVSRLREVATVARLTGARQTWCFGVKWPL